MKNRREDKPFPAWVGWIGDMSTPGEFLVSKPWASMWLPIKTANSFFRALGVVAFACNPLTGILIFSGMILGNYQVAIGGLVGGLVAIVASKILKVPEPELNNGVSVFNGILVGAVMTAVLPPTIGVRVDVLYCGMIIIATFLTTYVDQGLNALMAPSKLPGQSVPFNIVSTLLFIIFKGLTVANDHHTSGNMDDDPPQDFQNETLSVEWTKVLEGAVLSTGQIYGVGTMAPSICIWIGFLLYSPLLSLMFFVGATMGSFSGVLFSTGHISDVYQGLWGYNALLASGGMAFFVVFTPNGLLSCLVNALIAVGVQAALIPAFSQTSLPVLSYPFNVAIMLTLAIATRKKPPLIFVTDRSFPELHIYIHKKGVQIQGPQDEEISEVSLRNSEKW